MWEEGQDGWGVLWMTLGPPDQDVELYWWCRGIGGGGRALVFYTFVAGAPNAPGKPSEGVLGMLLQAKVKVLGRPLNCEVGGGWGVFMN